VRAVTVIVTGTAAGARAVRCVGVQPAGCIGGVCGTFVRLIQRGVVPLHAGINVGNQDSTTLNAKGGPEVICVCIGNPPIICVDYITLRHFRRSEVYLRLDVGSARGADIVHTWERCQGRDGLYAGTGDMHLVASKEGFIAVAISFQIIDHWFLASSGKFAQRVIDIPTARVPVFHVLSSAQISVFRH